MWWQTTVSTLWLGDSARVEMRINIANSQKGTKGAFLKHLIKQYAEEFETTSHGVLGQLKTGDPYVGEYFVNWLREQGWQVSWYQTPVPDRKYLPDAHSEWIHLSFGLLFNDSCDKLIAWRLAHP
jgi:hypothetical protein